MTVRADSGAVSEGVVTGDREEGRGTGPVGDEQERARRLQRERQRADPDEQEAASGPGVHGAPLGGGRRGGRLREGEAPPVSRRAPAGPMGGWGRGLAGLCGGA